MTGGGTATDGALSTDSAQTVTVATPTPDKMTETVSVVQYVASTKAGGRGAGAVPQLHPGRRRRASMQDALDHTKINTSLYDPTLVRRRIHFPRWPIRGNGHNALWPECPHRRANAPAISAPDTF